MDSKKEQNMMAYSPVPDACYTGCCTFLISSLIFAARVRALSCACFASNASWTSGSSIGSAPLAAACTRSGYTMELMVAFAMSVCMHRQLANFVMCFEVMTRQPQHLAHEQIKMGRV